VVPQPVKGEEQPIKGEDPPPDQNEDDDYVSKYHREEPIRRAANINRLLDARRKEAEINAEKRKHPNILKIPTILMKQHVSDNWIPEGVWFKLGNK